MLYDRQHAWKTKNLRQHTSSARDVGLERRVTLAVPTSQRAADINRTLICDR